MASGISAFYLFVTKHGGFEQFKRDADTNSNDTVQFNELYNYVMSNNQLSGIVSADDMYNIWRGLDVEITGNNPDASNSVSEDGSLNGTEEDRFKFRVTVYGEMSAKVGDVVREIAGNSAFSGYNLNEDALEALVIDSILDACNGNIERVSRYLNTSQANSDIRKFVLQGALVMVSEKLYESMQSYVASYNNYELKNDNDLKSLIKGYINTQTTTQGVDLNQIVNNLTNIIGKYMNTAGITTGQTYSAPVEWEGKMNQLQLAVLETNWRNAINNIPEASQYNSFSAELFENAIDTFIDAQKAIWTEASTNEFSTYNISASSIQSMFRDSDEMNILDHIVQMGEVADDVAGYEGNWSDFYGDGSASPNSWMGENDPRRIAAVIFYFGGFNIFNNEEFSQLFTQDVFMKYLKLAFKDITGNLEEYGISNTSTCTQQDLQNAVLKYFKNNLRSILRDMGVTDESVITNALYMNFNGTYDIIHNEKTENYGNYEIDELRTYAQTLVDYIVSKYGSNSEVAEVINEYYLYEIENLDIDELKEGIDALMEAVRTSVSEYHRLDPDQAAAAITLTVTNFVDAKNPSHKQTVRVWLRSIADRYLEDFTGWSIKDFKAGLEAEFEKWYNSPRAVLMAGIENLDSYKALIEEDCDNYNGCTDEQLAMLRQVLIDMIDYASVIGVRLRTFSNGELDPVTLGNNYGTSNAQDLYNLIIAIKRQINSINGGDMDALAGKYGDGTIEIYVSSNGKYVSTSRSVSASEIGNVSVNSDNDTGYTLYSKLDHAKNRVKCGMYGRIREQAQNVFNRYKITGWESWFESTFDENVGAAVWDNCYSVTGGWRVHLRDSCKDLRSYMQSSVENYIRQHL